MTISPYDKDEFRQLTFEDTVVFTVDQSENKSFLNFKMEIVAFKAVYSG